MYTFPPYNFSSQKTLKKIKDLSELGEIKKPRKGKPSSDGENGIGVGGFEIEIIIVSAEEADDLVEDQSAKNLKPHGAKNERIPRIWRR